MLASNPDLSVARWEVFRYRLPLRAPLTMLGITFHERSGLFLKLEDAGGHCGWGEIAPLPGIHRESESDCLAALQQLAPDFSRRSPLSSVRFGVAQAQQMLSGMAEGASPRSCVPQALESVQVNGLIPDTPSPLSEALETLAQHTQRLRKDGFSTVKIKVGRRPVLEDAERVRQAHRALGARVALRADANRAWTWDEALEFARGIQDLPLAYCEEPLQDPGRLEALHSRSGLPLALDESLWPTHSRDAPVPLPNGVKALILKPGALGDGEDLQFWIQQAQEHDAEVVFSSTFESGLGMHGLILLAAALSPHPAWAHGFDTHRFLAQDCVSPAFSLNANNATVSETWPAVQEGHPAVQRVCGSPP